MSAARRAFQRLDFEARQILCISLNEIANREKEASESHLMALSKLISTVEAVDPRSDQREFIIRDGNETQSLLLVSKALRLLTTVEEDEIDDTYSMGSYNLRHEQYLNHVDLNNDTIDDLHMIHETHVHTTSSYVRNQIISESSPGYTDVDYTPQESHRGRHRADAYPLHVPVSSPSSSHSSKSIRLAALQEQTREISLLLGRLFEIGEESENATASTSTCNKVPSITGNQQSQQQQKSTELQSFTAQTVDTLTICLNSRIVGGNDEAVRILVDSVRGWRGRETMLHALNQLRSKKV